MSSDGPKISRRELLKTVGLAGAGLTLSSPLAKAAPGTEAGPMPREDMWWVKTVDEPTTDIDWEQKERYSEWHTTRGTEYMDPETKADLTKQGEENVEKWEKEGKPGYTTKDMAFYHAHRSGLIAGISDLSFEGPKSAPTPEERGVPRWEGTPEENARILRAAMRHMGAATVGFLRRDDKVNKLIYDEDSDKKKILFSDEEVGYETENKRVLPNKAEWVIVYTVQMSGETLKRAPTPLGAATTMHTYARFPLIQNTTQEFIRALGYNCYGEAGINYLGIAPAMAVMAGLGELGRINRLITPEYGPMVRVFKMVTDLPLKPSKPIDFGAQAFCKRCKKCAIHCEPGALSIETEPYWEVQGGWNCPGHKAWFEDSVACREYWLEVGTNCGVCFAVCPYAKGGKAAMHEVVKAVSSTTPAFDSAFVAFDDALYEVQKNPEIWWTQNLPELGFDTSEGHEG